jgi:hypothetical protein
MYNFVIIYYYNYSYFNNTTQRRSRNKTHHVQNLDMGLTLDSYVVLVLITKFWHPSSSLLFRTLSRISKANGKLHKWFLSAHCLLQDLHVEKCLKSEIKSRASNFHIQKKTEKGSLVEVGVSPSCRTPWVWSTLECVRRLRSIWWKYGTSYIKMF